MKADSTNRWGYGYDSLLKDLDLLRRLPFVKVDSIGASVQGRAIWMITISDSSDSLGPAADPSLRKHRIMIHARTHPAEVQAHYVAMGAIRQLLDTGLAAEELRSAYIFNIIPMYNPDGVELGHSRLNANLVDLESNWNKPDLEPEVVVLKRTFEAFQAGAIPVEVALNLHSDQYLCSRFFFFHKAAGTSQAYEDLERNFIAGVRTHFPGGIEDWSYYPSWTDGFKSQYPESFWWTTEREKVLALTYEDTNCPNASGFDSTGRALALGAADYIKGRILAGVRRLAHSVSHVLLSAEGVRVSAEFPGSHWELRDVQGRRLAAGDLGIGTQLIQWDRLPASPLRILTLLSPSQAAERISLPMQR
jgi:hypothetical protein